MIKMRIFFVPLIVLFLGVIVFAQKIETMTIKVYFHNTKIDPDWNDCNKVYPVTRTIPRTTAVATAALQELLKGTTPEEARNSPVFRPKKRRGSSKA